MKRVFVYGCFDLFHSGHIKYLKNAKKIGKLFVGILPDAYVKETKGSQRPIISAVDRFEIISNFKFVYKTIMLKKTNINFPQLKGKEQEALAMFYDELLKNKINTLVLPSNIKISPEFYEILKTFKIELIIIPNDGEISTSKIIAKLQKNASAAFN